MPHANSPSSIAPAMRPLPFRVCILRRTLPRASSLSGWFTHSGIAAEARASSSAASSRKISTISGSASSDSTGRSSSTSCSGVTPCSIISSCSGAAASTGTLLTLASWPGFCSVTGFSGTPSGSQYTSAQCANWLISRSASTGSPRI